MSENERLDGELKERVDALPRSIEPPRDLWGGIAAAIRKEPRDDKVVRGLFRRAEAPVGHRWGSASWPRIGLLVAAGVTLVVTSSAITAYLVRVPAAPALTPEVGRAGSPPGFDTVALEQFRAAERDYQQVTAELVEALESGDLAPETVRTIQESLARIDDAISEARTALERDPANARLAAKLTDIYRKRVTFLRQMSRL